MVNISDSFDREPSQRLRRAKSSKRGADNNDSNSVPLPIQSFLWRQTNPFLGDKIGKLHEASCITFERVLVQNILHGLSPSLSDAIASVARWKIIQSALPHVILCCGALLQKRIRDGDMDQSLTTGQVKILYIMHWMLKDAASECIDNEKPGTESDKMDSVTKALHYLYPLNCIQLFVFTLAPLTQALKRSDFDENIRIDRSLSLWEALWSYRQPDIFCVTLPVKPRRSQLINLPFMRKSDSANAGEGDIYLGGDADLGGIYLGGDTAPAPKPVVVPKTLISSTKRGSILESQLPTQQKTITPTAKTATTSGEKQPAVTTIISKPEKKQAKKSKSERKKPAKKKSKTKQMVRSISEYKQKGKTHPLSIEDIAGTIQFAEESSTSGRYLESDKAPLVQLQDICGPTWPSFDLPSIGSRFQLECELCGTIILRGGSIVAMCACDKSTRPYRVRSREDVKPSEEESCSSQAPSIRVGGTQVDESVSEQESSFSERKPQADAASDGSPASHASTSSIVCSIASASMIQLTADESSTLKTQSAASLPAITPPTLVEALSTDNCPATGRTITPGSESPSAKLSRKSSTNIDFDLASQNETHPAMEINQHQATYFDVATLKCLFDKTWSEEGIHWGMQYFYGRLREIHGNILRTSKETRHRSQSVPSLPHVRIISPSISPRNQSKTDLDMLNNEDRRTPQWKDLKPNDDLSPTGSAGHKSVKSPNSNKKWCVLEIEDEELGTSAGCGTSTPLEGGRSSSNNHSVVERKQNLKTFLKTGTQSFVELANCVGRSFTDTQINYGGEILPEAVGSSFFIDREGMIKLPIIAKMVATVHQKKQSLRVAEISLNLIDVLLDLKVCDSCPSSDDKTDSSMNSRTSNLSTCSETNKQFQEPTVEEAETVLNLFLLAIIRIYQCLGCSHGCSDGLKTSAAYFLRGQARSLFSTLQKKSPTGFAQFITNFVQETDIITLNDFIHAFTGYCTDSQSTITNRGRSASKMSQDSKAKGETEMPTYRNNFLSAKNGVEGYLILAGLKPYVTKLMGRLSELQQPESMSLYRDIRAFMSYVQDHHGSPFRRVALSALLDAVDDKPPCSKTKQSTKPVSTSAVIKTDASISSIQSVASTVSEMSNISKPSIGLPLPSITINNTRQKMDGDQEAEKSNSAALKESSSLRRNVFKKLRDKDKDQPAGDDSADDDSGSSSPRLRHSSGETEHSGSPLLDTKNKRKGNKLQIALTKLKSGRSDNTLSNDDLTPEPSESEADVSTDEGQTKKKKSEGRRKISFKGTVRTLSVLNNLSGKSRRKSKNSDLSKDNIDQGSTTSLLANMNIPEKIPVNIAAVRLGAQRFSFYLETCTPGSIPDPGLMAALLDLKSPVISRAVIYIECCYFVNRCNRGQWPDWIRSNAPIGRTSSALGNRGMPSGMRRANLMQRAAGKMFYRWAESLGSYLDEVIEREKVKADDIVKLCRDEARRHQERLDDDLEDFMDESVVNKCGEACPYALKMVACMLLHEITTFLRETFQYLPREKGTVNKPTAHTSDRTLSQRRISILSSTFQPSQSGSIASIMDTQHDRRVSFGGHDDEVHSSHSTLLDETSEARRDSRGEHGLGPTRRMKIIRSSGSSFKRKSMKLRRRTGTDRSRDDPTEVKKRPMLASLRAKSIDIARKMAFSGSISSIEDTVQAIETVMPTLLLGHDLRKGSFPSPSDEPTSGSPDPITEIETIAMTETVNKLSPDVYHGVSPPPGTLTQPVPKPAPDADETIYYTTMPWLKTITQLASTSNFICHHQRSCHPHCFERQTRQCYRMTVALRKVYDESYGCKEDIDRRQHIIDSLADKSSDRASSVDRQRVSVHSKDNQVRLTIDKGTSAHLKHLLEDKQDTLDEKDKEKENKVAKKSNEPDIPKQYSRTAGSPMIKYMKKQFHMMCQAPLNTLLKSTLILTDQILQDVLPVAWELLLEVDLNIVSSAAAIFLVSSVKTPLLTAELLNKELRHNDPVRRIYAILRFYAVWRNRYHCWSKMEEGAQSSLKVPPPGIDFTLPSPPIGVIQKPCVDPPWMPHLKTKIQELTLNEEDTTSQTIMTMTKTRRKQKQEMMQRALSQAEEKKGEERRKYKLLTIPAQQQAAYEPALFQSITTVEEHDDEEITIQSRIQMPVSQPLFPSSLCNVTPRLVELLDDAEVGPDGISVSETARRVVWTCLVEETPLFIRYFLEKLTTRDKQEYLMGLFRRLLFFYKELPTQTAHALFNYLVGFVMYYVRQPCEGSHEAIGTALSLLWLVVPSVYGLTFKDMKQTLRKEQCDFSLMITANVPSAKKIVIHGPDQDSIPSQFPVHEDTQFTQLINDSVDFFNIPEDQAHEYFLIDSKSGVIHDPNGYVRDFYFFRRSFYPQLVLTHFDNKESTDKLRNIGFLLKNVELGKILLSASVLSHAPPNSIQQRIFFLHDELTKLPAFPRKALEACFGLYQESKGKALLGIDTLHKLSWSKLMASMFEGMENPYLYGDLHLFINVLNGVIVMHAEDSSVLRLCMATYINMAYNFKNLFATNGFFSIMPTILRCYSQHQTNILLCEIIEYVCKQFYIMHRKPFLLQMFGSAAGILDMVDADDEFDPMKVKAKHLFNLLLALERVIDAKDTIELMQLVKCEKPLKALDLCYRDDPNSFSILTDALASCITICAYAPDSRRSYQMLIVISAILKYYLNHLQTETRKANNSMAAVKAELNSISTLNIEIKALINCCDTLTRQMANQKQALDIINVSTRGKSIACDSPQLMDAPEDTIIIPTKSAGGAKYKSSAAWEQIDDLELQREIFRKPRDALLTVAAQFLSACCPRIKELSKSAGEQCKLTELLDAKSHIRLSDVALTLLKLAPYDQHTMTCEGLQRYFLEILPLTDWSQEQVRGAFNKILQRLDKNFSKIGKRGFRKRTNWDAVANWLLGLHQTIHLFPYMSHIHYLKTSIQQCMKIIVGDPGSLGFSDESASSVAQHAQQTILSSMLPPLRFQGAAIKLISLLMQTLGENAFGFEVICGTESLGNQYTDRIEAVLGHILLPLVLRACTGKKVVDVPRLRQLDISYIVNMMLNAIRTTVNRDNQGTSGTGSLMPPGISGLRPGGNTSNFVVPQIVTETGRSGSVSVSDKQSNANVLLASRSIRDSVFQIVFLGLKVVVIGFDKNLNLEWHKIAKTIKDLVHKRQGTVWLWNFIDFALSADTPLRLMIRSFVQNRVNAKVTSDIEQECMEQLQQKMASNMYSEPCLSKTTMLRDLAQELKTIKEEYSNRPLVDYQSSRTPTIVPDFQSDSSSTHSSRRQSDPRRQSDSRRLSFSTISRGSRLSPNPMGKSGVSPQESFHSTAYGNRPEEATILEEETTDEQTECYQPVEEKLPPVPKLVRKSTLRRSGKAKKRQSFHHASEYEPVATPKFSSVEDTRIPMDEYDTANVEMQAKGRHGSVVFKTEKKASVTKALSFDPTPTYSETGGVQRRGSKSGATTSTAAAQSKSELKIPQSPPKRHGAFRTTRSRSQSLEKPLVMASSSVDSVESTTGETPPEKQRTQFIHNDCHDQEF